VEGKYQLRKEKPFAGTSRNYKLEVEE